MKFFSTLKKSLTSTEFYAHISLSPMKSSVFFALKFYAILMLFALIPVGLGVFAISKTVDKYYPQNLKFHYENGTVKTEGITLPYKIKVAENVFVELREKEVQFSQGSNNSTYSYTQVFENSPPFSIERKQIDQTLPFFVPAVVLALAVAFVFFFLFFRVFVLFVYSFVVHTFANLAGKKVAYREVVHIGIHAIVSAELINIAYLLIYRSTQFPMFDIAFLGIMFLALRSRPRQIVRLG